MTHLSVYKNYAKDKDIYPYFIDVQSQLLGYLTTRLVMPLTYRNEDTLCVKILAPVLTIDDIDYIVLTSQLTTISINSIDTSEIVADASHIRNELIAAFDLLTLSI